MEATKEECDCGAKGSIKWNKVEISVGDKNGTYFDISFNFCDECGKVTNIEQDNYTKHDVFKAGAQWQASQQSKSLSEAVELSEAVKELLQVKEWKDKYGKDELYLKAQPIAWANLKTAYDAFLSQFKQ